jgi:hypothetical protein
MKKEIINQLQQFENFIELVEQLKTKIGEWGMNLAEFDLRDAFSNIHPFPMCLEDYSKIWFGTIMERYELYYGTSLSADEYFLDVYHNDKENGASYCDLVIWMRFHRNGIEFNPTTPIEYTKSDDEIYYELIRDFNRGKIISKAVRDQEKPFGALITYIRDVYGVPKTKGAKIVDRVLEHFKIDNEKY